MANEAMIGLWDQRLRVRHGGDPEEIREVVLDSGKFGPRGVESFEALLRTACARLASTGTTHLVALTSTASPGCELLTQLASRKERFFHLYRLAPGDQTNGIRIDATAF